MLKCAGRVSKFRKFREEFFIKKPNHAKTKNELQGFCGIALKIDQSFCIFSFSFSLAIEKLKNIFKK